MESTAAGGVTGRLTGAWIPLDSPPVSGGQVYAFRTAAGPPKRDRALHPPDGVATTNAHGKFTMDLPDGTYYLSVRKQPGKAAPGPPRDGELYGLIYGQDGKLNEYIVKRGETTDAGVLRRATPYKSRPVATPDGVTAISGMIRGSDGSPAADAVVHVYETPDTRGKPRYISRKTGNDGNYVVVLEKEGTYFLIARTEHERGRPGNAGTAGALAGSAAREVTVQKQGAKGIDISMGKTVNSRPQ